MKNKNLQTNTQTPVVRGEKSTITPELLKLSLSELSGLSGGVGWNT